MNQAASVGIIGGADGPTAIFVGSNSMPALLLIGLLILGALGVAVALLFFRR